MLFNVFGCLTVKQSYFVNKETHHIRNKVRLPLALMTGGAGLLGSVSMSLIKGFTEELRADEINVYHIVAFVVTAISVGLLQLKTLNTSMELYD